MLAIVHQLFPNYLIHFYNTLFIKALFKISGNSIKDILIIKRRIKVLLSEIQRNIDNCVKLC